MKLLKRIGLSLLILLVIIAIGGLFYVNNLKKSALPEYSGEVKLKNLREKVTVYRDQYAIPHIYAQNEADLYRATGYIMAQDRLWQMDLIRRVTQGRLSEIFGRDMLKADRLFRSLRITEKSDSLLKNEPEGLKTALTAFADGVNQYIEELGNDLPLEFKILGYKPDKWEAVNSLNLVGYMSWDLSMSWSTEMVYDKIRQKVSADQFAELFPDLDLEKTSVFPHFKFGKASDEIEEAIVNPTRKLQEMGLFVFEGSNNWAVAGKKSVTGKPLIANDMHLGLNAPGIWYQIHQCIPGKLNVTGLALPGQPMVVAGHNDSIAWGMTNVMLDDIDFYKETINPEKPNQYKFNGKWRDMMVKKETIKTNKGETINAELKFTHRGPIISEFKGTKDVVSMHWVGNDASNEVQGVYILNHAKNYSDFKKATEQFKAISQNFVYGDVQGNIAMQCAANIPIRVGDRKAIAPGDTDLYDWKGFVPFDSLPYSFNPTEGFVSSANNKTVGADYPHYISAWFDLPYRIDRIREMLRAKDKLSIADFKKMHVDQKSKQVELMMPKIKDALSKAKLSPMAQKAYDLIKNWDGNEKADAPQAAIYEMWYVDLVEQIFKDELGDKLYKEYIKQDLMAGYVLYNMFSSGKEVSWVDNVKTKNKKETLSDDIIIAFEKSCSDLEKKMGTVPENWKWGKIHTLTLKHPLGKVALLDKVFNLNRGPFPVGGSFHTVSPFSYPFGDLFHANHGASHRHIFSAGNWDESQTVIPTGESGIAASPYYCDQTKLYLKGIYHSDYFSRPLVEKDAKYTMILSSK